MLSLPLLDIRRHRKRHSVSAIALAQEKIGLFIILDQLCIGIEIQCSPKPKGSIREVCQPS